MPCWRWNGSLLIEAEIIFIEKGVTFRLVLGYPQTFNNVNISRFSTSLRLVNKYWWYHQWWHIVNIYCDKPYFLVCSIFIDDTYRSPEDLFIRTMILRALNIDNKYMHIYTYCTFDAPLLVIWQTNSKIGDVRFASSQIAISATGPWTDRSNLLANKW